jgi:D-alanyl-D-alanine carboxypeptidase
MIRTSRLFARLAPIAAASVLILSARSAGNAATASLVMDATTGYVLESDGATKKLQIGSLTKIATACVALDWLEAAKRDAGDLVEISRDAAATPGRNAIGLMAGDRLSLRDLLYAAMMQSDNIAAQVIAEQVGDTLGGAEAPAVKFVAQMNALARRLGMARTLFLNPHGLDGLERKLPYSTAEDVGRLTKYAMAKSAFRFYVSQAERQIAIHRGGGQIGYRLRNTNELLGTDDIDGVKTGSTRRAGECVVLSSLHAPESKQEGNQFIITPRRIIVVVIGSSNRFREGAALIERGWNRYEAWAVAGRPIKRGSAL